MDIQMKTKIKRLIPQPISGVQSLEDTMRIVQVINDFN